jgi:ADP-ribosyl-[dinitrogen reductase] hydrolase
LSHLGYCKMCKFTMLSTLAKMISDSNQLPMRIKSTLVGLATGDALGVPVEFVNRASLKRKPVCGMNGYGSHNQPPGTWSDDSSLSFCLAESLIAGFNPDHSAELFIRWKNEGYWGAHNQVFDIGITTSKALSAIEHGKAPELAGGTGEFDNGNGSLMRMAPLLFHIYDKPLAERFDKIRVVSSVTHRHIRSVTACIIYLEFARLLFAGCELFQAYQSIKEILPTQLLGWGVPISELEIYHRILIEDISLHDESEIKSSGYVVYTLEASLWCLLSSNNYADAVLKAVNLGDDTDTTGAICGALAGLYYGMDGIPKEWLDVLVRRNDIIDLGMRLAKSVCS